MGLDTFVLIDQAFRIVDRVHRDTVQSVSENVRLGPASLAMQPLQPRHRGMCGLADLPFEIAQLMPLDGGLSMTKRKRPLRIAAAGTKDGVSNVIDLFSRARPRRRAVHNEQVVCGKVLAFTGKRTHQGGPMTDGDPAALFPLLNELEMNPEVGPHLGDGFPLTKNVVQSLHADRVVGTAIPCQPGTAFPATTGLHKSKIRRMGRTKSPAEFNRLFSERLRAARISAGYDSMPPFAKAIGVEWERYKKWEAGRTAVPHEHLPRICELTGKDPNFFYGMAEQQKAVKSA